MSFKPRRLLPSEKETTALFSGLMSRSMPFVIPLYLRLIENTRSMFYNPDALGGVCAPGSLVGVACAQGSLQGNIVHRG